MEIQAILQNQKISFIKNVTQLATDIQSAPI